jgi:polar amino acid transport system substrate-binding protein
MFHSAVVVAVLSLMLPASLQTGSPPPEPFRAAFLSSNPVQGRIDARTGMVTGPAADLTRELARRMGRPAHIVPAIDAAAVIALVRSRQVDIGFLAFEAARASQVEFSIPYALMGSAYLVRADAAFDSSADVDRAGVTIGAVTGQSQEIYVSEHVKNADIVRMPVVPSPDAVATMVRDGRVQAFAANRQRVEDIARSFPGLRVLSDNFMVNGQAIVVPAGESARIAELNRFLTDVLASGFVKNSLERNGAAGVEVAPIPR